MITQTEPASTTACDPADSLTKSLLGYGVIAGPIYVTVSLAQALTREGFDLSRHAWSQLSNGDLGWLQITNFVLVGVMTVAGAIGLGRALRGGLGATWAARLLAVYGVSLIAAGAFRADPGGGFPVGSPTEAVISWHGMVHFLAGGVGFLAFFGACLVVARRYAAEHRPGWALFSRIAGVWLLVAFVGVAAGAGASVTILAFVTAVILAWTWLTAAALDRYRRVGRS
jgi:hypothetical protein